MGAAASQLMPAGVVEELAFGERDTVAKVQREVSSPGSGLAKLWEDRSLFTQELSQNQSEKQQLQTQTKGSYESEQQVVTLQEEMNVQEEETPQEEVTVTPAEDGTSVMEVETSFQSE